jgi:hypothetical protein
MRGELAMDDTQLAELAKNSLIYAACPDHDLIKECLKVCSLNVPRMFPEFSLNVP